VYGYSAHSAEGFEYFLDFLLFEAVHQK
jgi:hypothetical protein